jgi:hypothetical protein
MLAQFAQLVKSLFPSVAPSEAQALVRAGIRFGQVNADFFATSVGSKLCQGDVVDSLPFVVQIADGTFRQQTRPGLLLSHSCDVDEGKSLTFAACYPFAEIATAGHASAVRANQVFGLLYLPGHGTRSALVADLSQTTTFDRLWVLDGIAQGRARRVLHFTDLGHYLFVAKLTIHLLRPQPADEVRGESHPAIGERIRDAMLGLVSLGRYVVRGR